MLKNTESTIRQDGFSLLEVIITMFIIAIGMLGLAGLQARALNAEVESFSRAQAIMLANQMADRMGAGLTAVKASTAANSGYNQQTSAGVKTVFGAGYTNDCVSTSNTLLDASDEQAACCAAKGTIPERDLCEWDLALKGIGQSKNGAKVGAMTGARACVFDTTPASYSGTFQIDVVWQGRDVGVVPSDNLCGSTAITSRRSGVSRIVRVAVLDGA